MHGNLPGRTFSEVHGASGQETYRADISMVALQFHPVPPLSVMTRTVAWGEVPDAVPVMLPDPLVLPLSAMLDPS